MKRKQTNSSVSLLKGAAALSIAAIVSKLIGTLQKIPLQNIGGDGVFGIYNTVYPFYTLMITLAAAGIPTVVSKFVAERRAEGDAVGEIRVLRTAAWAMLSFGAAGALLMYLGAPLLAEWIGSSQLVSALRGAAPALFFVPLSAALRGYFQGQKNMLPTAVSQVTEQVVRVAVMVGLLLYFTAQGAAESTVAGSALAGSAFGGVAGLFVMLLYWQDYRKHREYQEHQEQQEQQGQQECQERQEQQRQQERQKHRECREAGSSREGSSSVGTASWSPVHGGNSMGLLREMLRYGIPICLAALAVPLISLVDTFTLPRLLAFHGDELKVMTAVGIYNRGMPLVQLVTMLATSLSMLYIPVMAELNAKGDQKGITRHTGLALRSFWLIGLAASAGLAVLAEPINTMLYKDSIGSATFAWVAWSAAPGALATITAALLQGLGRVRAPAVHLLAAAVLKAALNVLLVPQHGMTGAAIAGIAAYGCAAALNLALLLRRTGLRPRLADVLVRPAAAILAMLAAVLLLRLAAAASLPPGRLAALAESLLGVLLGAAVFAAAAVRARLITAAELGALPRYGPKLVQALRSLRLLP